MRIEKERKVSFKKDKNIVFSKSCVVALRFIESLGRLSYELEDHVEVVCSYLKNKIGIPEELLEYLYTPIYLCIDFMQAFLRFMDSWIYELKDC